MDKQQLQQKMDEAENRCRILFDQATTLEQNLAEVRTELERSRGDFRTLQKLIAELPPEEGASPVPTGTVIPGQFPAGQPADQPVPMAVPAEADSKVKDKEKKA